MAVTKTEKKVFIELVGYQTHAREGAVYHAGVAYECSREEADRLLSIKSEGKPLFGVYVPKKAEPTVTKEDGTPVASLPKAEAPEAPVTPPTKEEPAPINLTTAEEEAELEKAIAAEGLTEV